MAGGGDGRSRHDGLAGDGLAGDGAGASGTDAGADAESGEETTAVRRVQIVGVALVCGGIALAALSYIVPTILLAGGVLLVAVIVHFEVAPETPGIALGPAVGIIGVLLLVEATLELGFGARGVAALVVAGGVFEVLAAPWLVSAGKSR